MEDLKIDKISIADINSTAQKEKHSAQQAWGWLIAICILIVVVSFVFFMWKIPPLDNNKTIDHDRFGTFGDFIGGFLGTIVAIFSVYFLVRTLHSQIKSNVDTQNSNNSVITLNEKLLELNNLQLFDNQFQTLYKQYLNAINNYSYIIDDKNVLTGRRAFEKKVSDFLDQQFNNGLEYNRRSKAAVSLFEDFYAENRIECSVHLRILYLLVNLIAEADIDEHNRVVYAKCIRGQLSEGELAILRYHCMTDTGEKMQHYVNHFNLLKHLPLMIIFEFRQWHDTIKDEQSQSALDSLFIFLKKGITNLNDNPDKGPVSYNISSRYCIKYYFDNSNVFNLEIDKKKKHQNGGGVKRPFCEKALDQLDENQLTELFEAFLYEFFVAGSFGLYNDEKDCKVGQKKVLKSDDGEYVVRITVMKEKKFVLAERQVVPGT